MSEMDCLQCKGPIEKKDESILSNYICHRCWGEMSEGRQEYVKPLFAIMLLMSVTSAMSWSSFVSLPLEEKMLIMEDRLAQIENGSLYSSSLTKAEATKMHSDMDAWCREFKTSAPDEYSKAEGNVKSMVFLRVNETETKFIKVGDVYISETICKASPEQCVVAPEPVVKNKTVVANKRTAAECSAARQKDWEVFCWQNARTISCDAVAQIDKTMILDNLAQGYYSNQAICLRGE